VVDAIVLTGGAIEVERLLHVDPTIVRKPELPLLSAALVKREVRGP
jgi:hypothetical protein